jgi:iron-sulfur cluster repair protein YtfE (RIC family)
MTECTLDSSVPDWVIEHPVTLAVLQTLGIDYCCGGKSLEFASREQGFEAAAVLKTLLRAIEVNRGNDPDATASN